MVRDFSHNFQNELDFMRALNAKALINDAIIDVPQPLAKWYSTIIYCRFNCIILGRDFDEVWRETNL